MGLFDTIKCEVLLPLQSEIVTTPFQTKSFDNTMSNYVITAKGELYEEVIDYEWIEDDTHIFKGYLKEIRGSYHRNYLTDYHGDVIFYESPLNGKWIDYYARFTNGRLSKIWYTEGTY